MEILVKSVAPSLLSISATPMRTTSWRLDMGRGYDCFDPMAHLMASGLKGGQRANRMLLALLMARRDLRNGPTNGGTSHCATNCNPILTSNFPALGALVA